MQDRWRMRKDVAFYVWMGIAVVIMAIACWIYMASSNHWALMTIMVIPAVYMAGHFLGSYYFKRHAVTKN